MRYYTSNLLKCQANKRRTPVRRGLISWGFPGFFIAAHRTPVRRRCEIARITAAYHRTPACDVCAMKGDARLAPFLLGRAVGEGVAGERADPPVTACLGSQFDERAAIPVPDSIIAGGFVTGCTITANPVMALVGA